MLEETPAQTGGPQVRPNPNPTQGAPPVPPGGNPDRQAAVATGDNQQEAPAPLPRPHPVPNLRGNPGVGVAVKPKAVPPSRGPPGVRGTGRGVQNSSQGNAAVASVESAAMGGYNDLVAGFSDIFGATFTVGNSVANTAVGQAVRGAFGIKGAAPTKESLAYLGNVSASGANQFLSNTAAYVFPGGAILHGVGDVHESVAARAFDVAVGALVFIPGIGGAASAAKGAAGFAVKAAAGSGISAVGTALQGGSVRQVLLAAGIGAVVGGGAGAAVEGLDSLRFTKEFVDITPGSTGPLEDVGLRTSAAFDTTENGQLIPGERSSVAYNGLGNGRGSADIDFTKIGKGTPVETGTSAGSTTEVEPNILKQGNVSETSGALEDFYAKGSAEEYFSGKAFSDTASRIEGGEAATGRPDLLVKGIYENVKGAPDFTQVGRGGGSPRPVFVSTESGGQVYAGDVLVNQGLSDTERSLVQEVVYRDRFGGEGLGSLRRYLSSSLKGFDRVGTEPAPPNAVTQEDLELFQSMGEPGQGREQNFFERYQGKGPAGPGGSGGASGNPVVSTEEYEVVRYPPGRGAGDLGLPSRDSMLVSPPSLRGPLKSSFGKPGAGTSSGTKTGGKSSTNTIGGTTTYTPPNPVHGYPPWNPPVVPEHGPVPITTTKVLVIPTPSLTVIPATATKTRQGLIPSPAVVAVPTLSRPKDTTPRVKAAAGVPFWLSPLGKGAKISTGSTLVGYRQLKHPVGELFGGVKGPEAVRLPRGKSKRRKR